jgi:hypothetical protein
MKRAFFILANVLALGGAASAEVPKATTNAAPSKTVFTTPAPTARAPFGCDARAPNVCRFRIFYKRGDRIVILPAGMKQKIPVTLGSDHYCMTLGKNPAYKCTRKVINDKYNS